MFVVELRAARSRRSVLRRVARAAEDNVQYTIGENSACDQYNDTVYCNGQLPESTSFVYETVVFQRMYPVCVCVCVCVWVCVCVCVYK